MDEDKCMQRSRLRIGVVEINEGDWENHNIETRLFKQVIERKRKC